MPVRSWETSVSSVAIYRTGVEARDLKDTKAARYLKLKHFLGLIAAELPQGEVRHRDVSRRPVNPRLRNRSESPTPLRRCAQLHRAHQLM